MRGVRRPLSPETRKTFSLSSRENQGPTGLRFVESHLSNPAKGGAPTICYSATGTHIPLDSWCPMEYTENCADGGDLIRGTGGFRKVRVARKGTGKSGGARVVYIWRNQRFPVLLITVFPKNEKKICRRQSATRSRSGPIVFSRTFSEPGEAA